MIEKIIPGDSQEELIKTAGRLVQVYESSRHIKQAASNMFSRADLEKFAPPAGKFLSHMITMGSSDLYGANRNADDFPHEQLLKHHDRTFMKYARNYREHQNNDPKKAVGEIKAAKYDPVKQRGEILMWTDIDKAASEFEKARRGEEQHGSMACSVDHDLCECCGFKSKTAAERCEHIRYSPGVYFPEFQKYAHMLNVEPTFKDYSWVGRPADRIAHTLNYLMPLGKAASTTRHLRGDELAELYGVVSSPWLPALRKIAEFDADRFEDPAKQAAHTTVLPRAFEGEFSDELLQKMSNHPYPGRVMRSLLERRMVMPLASFNSYVTGRCLHDSANDPIVKEASQKLASTRMIIIQRLQAEPTLSSAFSEACNQFEPMSCGCDDVVDLFMDKARDQFSLRYEALAKRACYNAPRVVGTSKEAASAEAFGLAALYNAYLSKVASLVEDDWILHAQMSRLR